MDFSERKKHTELLLDAAALSSDIELLENNNPRSRVLARRTRLHHLQFEIIWELLSFVNPTEIMDYRQSYKSNNLMQKTEVATPPKKIAVDPPKKNTSPRKKSIQRSTGKK